MVSILIQLLFFAGVVHLKIPKGPVCYNKTEKLECTVQHDLQTSPRWQLKSKERSKLITNGTQATLTQETLRTTVTITGVDALWEGISVSATIFTLYLQSTF